MTNDNWEKIADLQEFENQERLSVIIDETPALLIRNEGQLTAIEDVCTHDGQPLTDGEISAGSIECPRHGARFDLQTGAVLCMPATEPIRVFEVSQREDGYYARPKADPTGNENNSAGTDVASAENSVLSAAAQAATGETAEQSSSNPFLDPPGEGAMLDALKQVIDPELFVNIVDLGLVYDISKEEHNENNVVVTMTLTSPACPAGPQLVSQARSALEKMPGVHHAEIKLTMSPPWGPEMMTEDARDQLGIF